MASGRTNLGIVVGVDESPGALRWAAHEAALRKVPLTLVRVGPMPASGSSALVWTTAPTLDELHQRHADDARQMLSNAIKIIEDGADIDDIPAINSKLLYSAHRPTLIDLSKEARIAVVGRSPHGASGRDLRSSIANGLVHLAHCPVAVIHAENSPSPQLPVLVGIDGSGGSQLATEIAFTEASLRGVELVALHAWSDSDTSTMPKMESSTVQSGAQQVLAEGLAGWQDCYPDVKVRRIVVHDDPVRHLLEKSCSAQLLVVGSHGRGRWPGTLGSVSTAMVGTVDIPVVVAR
jgi:nucleotide-binding universal stress UspA family protein